MIRFIDLRHHTDDLAGCRFAFYDTVTDRFVEDDINGHTWETINQFAQGYNGSHEIARFVALTPEWAKHAAPDKEAFKLEIEDQGSMRAYATARNLDGSAACHVPLSPSILQAMQGRSVAYFYGEQTYGIEKNIGAIEGQIVINFSDEAEGESW